MVSSVKNRISLCPQLVVNQAERIWIKARDSGLTGKESRVVRPAPHCSLPPLAWEAMHAEEQNLQAPTKGAHNATCRSSPPRKGDSPRPSRALHGVAALEQNLPPCEAFIKAFSSNSEDIIIKFYSRPFSILWGGEGRVQKKARKPVCL